VKREWLVAHRRRRTSGPAPGVCKPDDRAPLYFACEHDVGSSVAIVQPLVPLVAESRTHFGPSSRALLQKLRRTIRSILPEVEECISYRLPAFRYRGSVIAGFSATSKGCSYYPFSGTTLKTLAGDIEGYGKTKSALHFGPDKPLPTALVRKLLHARIAEGERPRAEGRSA
jgi:uncharacterized protein YdhG (YjbR/CyaY superfamily)